jgi:hypothetical protein
VRARASQFRFPRPKSTPDKSKLIPTNQPSGTLRAVAQIDLPSDNTATHKKIRTKTGLPQRLQWLSLFSPIEEELPQTATHCSCWRTGFTPLVLSNTEANWIVAGASASECECEARAAAKDPDAPAERAVVTQNTHTTCMVIVCFNRDARLLTHTRSVSKHLKPNLKWKQQQVQRAHVVNGGYTRHVRVRSERRQLCTCTNTTMFTYTCFLVGSWP